MSTSQEEKISTCFNKLKLITAKAKTDLNTLDANFSRKWLTDKKFYIRRRKILKQRFETLGNACTVLFELLFEIKTCRIPIHTIKKGRK